MNWFTLYYDNSPPSNFTISINNGAVYATQQLVNVTLSTTDSDTAGYRLKLWGDVDSSFDSNIQSTEATSSYFAYTTNKQIKLSSGEGNKVIYALLMDDLYNATTQISDNITLDTSIPTVTTSSPDVTKISKQNGKDTVTFSFQSPDTSFIEYKVCVVPSSASTENVGTVIGTSFGSINMSGTGSFAMNTPISCTIKGKDLELASSGDGNKIIKVFIKDAANQWSI